MTSEIKDFHHVSIGKVKLFLFISTFEETQSHFLICHLINLIKMTLKPSNCRIVGEVGYL